MVYLQGMGYGEGGGGGFAVGHQKFFKGQCCAGVDHTSETRNAAQCLGANPTKYRAGPYEGTPTVIGVFGLPAPLRPCAHAHIRAPSRVRGRGRSRFDHLIRTHVSMLCQRCASGLTQVFEASLQTKG